MPILQSLQENQHNQGASRKTGGGEKSGTPIFPRRNRISSLVYALQANDEFEFPTHKASDSCADLGCVAWLHPPKRPELPSIWPEESKPPNVSVRRHMASCFMSARRSWHSSRVTGLTTRQSREDLHVRQSFTGEGNQRKSQARFSASLFLVFLARPRLR